ncbi:MAG: Na+/H+ antiporter NhaC family protein [Micrococcus sp.]|nr:Na+/H+ antiporter NhaC family protein [Micrococcus sp.]
MEALTNPVLLSVLLLCVLALLNVHVILALLIATLAAGLLSGRSVMETLEFLIAGLGNQGETAIAYLLLGILAVMVSRSGVTEKFVDRLLPWISGRRGATVFLLAGLACLSQNVVPVHIAFIPLLIPPLLAAFNRMKVDRRAVAAALTFGLKAPYLLVPLGFGLIFQGIVVRAMGEHGMELEISQMPIAMAIPVAGMVVGLLFAVLISYRKDREYLTVESTFTQRSAGADEPWGYKHTVVVLALAVSLVLQLVTESLVLAALGGVLLMFLLRVETWKQGEKIVPEGVALMGTIAFVMLLAAGYANVLTETESVAALVDQMGEWVGGSQLAAAVVMMVVGLVVTMGIGTSFGTVPVIAAIFVPLAASLGFSPLATAAMIGTAGALGDAGSPASDSTLGPTSGLNADGQHSHIWDTCVPTFLHYNIPLFAGGVIAGLVL